MAATAEEVPPLAVRAERVRGEVRAGARARSAATLELQDLLAKQSAATLVLEEVPAGQTVATRELEEMPEALMRAAAEARLARAAGRVAMLELSAGAPATAVARAAEVPVVRPGEARRGCPEARAESLKILTVPALTRQTVH
jgi:hypothetical protein